MVCVCAWWCRAVVGRQMTADELEDFLTLDCYPHLTVTKGTPARL